MKDFKVIGALGGTIGTYLFGGWDTAIIILCIFICTDYVTGLIKGIVKKDLSSNVGLLGIARKALIFIVLIVAVLLDRLLNTEQWLFRTLVCYFYIANEGISILENCVVIGLPVPEAIQKILIQIKEKTDKGEN